MYKKTAEARLNVKLATAVFTGEEINSSTLMLELGGPGEPISVTIVSSDPPNAVLQPVGNKATVSWPGVTSSRGFTVVLATEYNTYANTVFNATFEGGRNPSPVSIPCGPTENWGTCRPENSTFGIESGLDRPGEGRVIRSRARVGDTIEYVLCARAGNSTPVTGTVTHRYSGGVSGPEGPDTVQLVQSQIKYFKYSVKAIAAGEAFITVTFTYGTITVSDVVGLTIEPCIGTGCAGDPIPSPTPGTGDPLPNKVLVPDIHR